MELSSEPEQADFAGQLGQLSRVLLHPERVRAVLGSALEQELPAVRWQRKQRVRRLQEIVPDQVPILPNTIFPILHTSILKKISTTFCKKLGSRTRKYW
jgi:hypothetical protein